MAQQKLYTEEQVRQSFIAGMEFIAVDPLKYEQDANEYMNSITPIEVPTDEEIWEESNKEENFQKDFYFSRGAEWMRKKILNK